MTENEHPQPQLKKTVSVLHLVSISYLLVSAGPFGQEEAINAGGALYVFIAVLCVPLVYSLPLALISSEQASRLPACGGAVEWGLVLGKFMSYVNCYVRFMRSVFDNALYPVMVYDYINAVIPGMDKWYHKTIVVLLSNAFSVICNLAGIEAVGWSSVALAIIILAPFVLFFSFSVKFMTPDLVFARYPPELGSPDLANLLSTVIWQFSGFDTVAALSEETANPRRTFPLAMLLTVILVTIVYLLPTIAGVCAEPDLTQWMSGSFSSVARKLPYCSNGWLSFWISLAGAFSSLSLLNVALTCTGRELYAGGKIGAFPFSSFVGKMQKNFKKEPLPVRGILIMSFLTIPLSFLNFDQLIEWTGLLTVIAQFIQIAIFIACRIPSCMENYRKTLAKSNDDNIVSLYGDSESEQSIPNLEDKFIICGGWPGAICNVVPLVAVSVFMCVCSGWISLLVCVALVAIMFGLKGIEMGIMCALRKCEKSSECDQEKEDERRMSETPFANADSQ